jgi:hypothetical protein
MRVVEVTRVKAGTARAEPRRDVILFPGTRRICRGGDNITIRAKTRTVTARLRSESRGLVDGHRAGTW